jgi:hypothetical protein
MKGGVPCPRRPWAVHGPCRNVMMVVKVGQACWSAPAPCKDRRCPPCRWPEVRAGAHAALDRSRLYFTDSALKSSPLWNLTALAQLDLPRGGRDEPAAAPPPGRHDLQVWSRSTRVSKMWWPPPTRAFRPCVSWCFFRAWWGPRPAAITKPLPSGACGGTRGRQRRQRGEGYARSAPVFIQSYPWVTGSGVLAKRFDSSYRAAGCQSGGRSSAASLTAMS